MFCKFTGAGHVHKYKAVLWTLEKTRKTIFCYKMINFSLRELKFSGNMYFLVILKGLHQGTWVPKIQGKSGNFTYNIGWKPSKQQFSFVVNQLFQFDYFINLSIRFIYIQRQSPRGVPRVRYSEIYKRTPTPKCNFNKIALQLYWNRTSEWVFSCKFAAYFQNTFS